MPPPPAGYQYGQPAPPDDENRNLALIGGMPLQISLHIIQNTLTPRIATSNSSDCVDPSKKLWRLLPMFLKLLKYSGCETLSLFMQFPLRSTREFVVENSFALIWSRFAC